MTDSGSPSPTLWFYRRAPCHLCDEARAALQAVLEQRVLRGDPVPRVREIDLADEPALEQTHGSRVPVLAIRGSELALATSARQIGAWLDRTIGRLG